MNLQKQRTLFMSPTRAGDRKAIENFNVQRVLPIERHNLYAGKTRRRKSLNRVYCNALQSSVTSLKMSNGHPYRCVRTIQFGSFGGFSQHDRRVVLGYRIFDGIFGVEYGAGCQVAPSHSLPIHSNSHRINRHVENRYPTNFKIKFQKPIQKVGASDPRAHLRVLKRNFSGVPGAVQWSQTEILMESEMPISASSYAALWPIHSMYRQCRQSRRETLVTCPFVLLFTKLSKEFPFTFNGTSHKRARNSMTRRTQWS